MAQGTVIINEHGPLPIEGNFKTEQSNQILIVAGSAFTRTANKIVGVEIIVDNNEVGEAEIWANPAKTHTAVVPQYLALQLPKGDHTLKLQASTNDTVTDHNDFFRVLLIA